jgi:hypothetical protein
MKKKLRSMVAGLVVILGCTAYFYSSLVPPLEIKTKETSSFHTKLAAKNKGFLSVKIETFYINNNEVPPEASINTNGFWRPARGQKIFAGQKKKIRILHDFPVRRMVIVYKYGGIPFTTTYQIKNAG